METPWIISSKPHSVAPLLSICQHETDCLNQLSISWPLLDFQYSVFPPNERFRNRTTRLHQSWFIIIINTIIMHKELPIYDRIFSDDFVAFRSFYLYPLNLITWAYTRTYLYVYIYIVIHNLFNLVINQIVDDVWLIIVFFFVAFCCFLIA